MPVRNEEHHLAAAVRGVLAQPYEGPLEIIVAVGPSRDKTADVAAGLAAADPRIRVLDNPAGRTPHALNLAIAAARYDIIVRLDGHGELGENYLVRAVALLQRTGAANVGGVMDARGETPFQEAVAWAYSNRLGLGGSTFHRADSPEGPADTVFLGVFRKAALQEVGGFDESMHRAQDWELNYRLRTRGHLVWFSPALTATYHPRASLGALIRQMYDTGRWRREVVRRHPDTASLRYLAPPVTVLSIVAGSLLGLLGLRRRSRRLTSGLAAPLGYLALIVGGAMWAPDVSPAARRRLPVVLAATHLAWGTGFLTGRSPSGKGEGRAEAG